MLTLAAADIRTHVAQLNSNLLINGSREAKRDTAECMKTIKR